MGETQEQVMARYNNINIAVLPEVSRKAIEKLRSEKTDDMTELLRALVVLAIADGDETLAQRIVSSANKTLATCWSHIVSWLQKKPRKGNALAVNHEDVASEAIHYYLDVEEKPQKPMTLPTKQVEEEIELPKCDNMGSLFGDDDEEEEPELSKVEGMDSLFGDDF